MKHRGQESRGFQIGQWLGAELVAAGLGTGFDTAIPIPAYWTRYFYRGANVATSIADGLSRRTGIPISDRALVQVRATAKQGTLTRSRRRQNVQGAFRVRPRFPIRGRQVLLIDDVLTSGATINEAARTLRRAGATRVAAAVVARGVGART